MRPNTKGHDLQLEQATKPPWYQWTDFFFFNHQYLLLRYLQSKGEIKEKMHILRYEEIALAYKWFNFLKWPLLWPFRHAFTSVLTLRRGMYLSQN